MNFLRHFPRVLRVQRYHERKINNQNLDEDILDIKFNKSLSFYIETLGITNLRARELLKNNPSLCCSQSDLKDVKVTVDFLKEQNISVEDMIARPKALLINRMTTANRLKVLDECSFDEPNLLFLYKFVTVMNKSVSILKAFNYIKRDVNVPDNLIKKLDVNIVPTLTFDDSMSLQGIREIIMNCYLQKKLSMSDADVIKYWRSYNRLKHRSFQCVVEVVQILENRLKFRKDRIVNNGFLLYACPDNLNQIMSEIPKIGSSSIEEVILKRPKIAMQNVETIKSILGHMKTFDIPEERILKCLDLLTLGADTVYERLVELSKISEFKVLKSNPRVLRLIHYQNKAKTRLDYLKQMKVKCASLHVLSSSSDTFEKYARDGVDRTKGKDAVFFIAKVLKMNKEVVRDTFSRHPNWCHVPVMSIKNAFDFLRYKKFSEQEISENIHLLLYPMSRIEQKLNALLEWKEENDGNRMISGVALSAISNSKLLNLCLYFIESEFHFSGDGIWDANRSDNKQQDLYPTTIPDFPKTLTKVYRYGVTGKKSEESKAAN